MYECVYSGQEGGHFRRLENNFIIGLAFRIGMPFDMGPEGLRGCRRAPPNGAGSTAGDLIGAVSRPTKRGSGRESAHCNEPKLAVVGRRFTMGLKQERQ